MNRPFTQATPARPKRLLGLMGAGVIVALGGGLLAATPVLAISKPVGSHVLYLLDSRDPASAATSGTSWTGHSLFMPTTTTEADFGCPVGDSIAWAVTPASTDGSTEQPLIAAEAPARDAYKWTPPSKEVDAYFTPAKLLESNNNPAAAGATFPISSTTLLYAKGQFESTVVNGGAESGVRMRALQPAGTELSMVGFCAHNSATASQPVLSRGSDGRAISSWFHFRAVANATGTYTSTAFELYEDKTATSLGLSGTAQGTTGTLTATITGAAGTITEAAGTVSFYAGEDSTAPLLDTVTVASGVATLPLTGLEPGGSPVYSAVYTPSTDAAAIYLPASSSPYSLIVPATPVETTPPATTPPATTPPVTTPPATTPPVTTPPVTTPPVTTPTLANARIAASIPAASFGKAVTAKVSVGVGSAGATGVVAMSIDKKVVRRVVLASGTSAVVLPATLIAGKHTLTIAYAGNATTRPLTFSKVFAVAKATPTLTVKLSSSKAVAKKTALKATVAFVIPGSKTLPTGKVTIKVGSKVVKTINVTAANKGKVVITLPKFTKTSSKVVVTATYAGSPNIAAKASAPAAVKVVKK